jgi:hypothetical protein
MSKLKNLLSDIKSFALLDFHFYSYLYCAVVIVVITFGNYYFDFYKTILRQSYFDGNSIVVMMVFYLFVYFLFAIPHLILRKNIKALKSKEFWFKSVFVVGLYSIAIGYYSYRSLEFSGLFDIEKAYVFRLIAQLKGFVVYFTPFVLLKYFYDKKVNGVYGLTKSFKGLSAYLYLYLIFLPVLILASFTPEFANAYPQFEPAKYTGVFGMPTWLYTAIFEFTYVVDFVMTELVFRGLLVIGMLRVLGKDAILPMVGLYVAIHFGKPLTETISSAFGGYILGALAFRTQHIWGGVLIHVLVALAMEIMGFLK